MTTSNDTTLTKVCTGPCGRTLPATLEFFSAHKHGKYGLQAKCRECHREWEREHRSSASYRAEHREQEIVRHAIYRATHQTEIRESGAVYRTTHAEAKRTYNREYRQNPEKQEILRAAKHRRRARELQAEGAYTPSELQAVMAAHTNSKHQLVCAFCHKVISGAYEIDHWIPLKLGGMNIAGNLRVMHPKCNRKKNAKHPHELGLLL